MISPPSAPTIKIGAYALVMIALGKLKTSPKTNPISQPGQVGNCTKAITNPMPNRLKNAPSKAAVLSGNDIGNIIPTETKPKITPLKRPEDNGATWILDQFAGETVQPNYIKDEVGSRNSKTSCFHGFLRILLET
jgi:hypothetical protein